MGTIEKINGLRVVIYPADHRPAHVHVIGPGFEVAYLLNCPNGPVELRDIIAGKPSKKELSRIREALDAVLPKCCSEWRKVHGRYY